MSGEHACLSSRRDDYRVLVVPSPLEAQGHADDLRDMLAAGELDQRVVRAAANAFEALAIAGNDAATLTDGPLPAPFGPDQ